MKKLFTIFAISMFLGTAAHAGFLVDPYFDYIVSGNSGAISGSSLTGSELGARLGWEYLGLGIGLDALISGSHSLTTNGTSVSSTPSYYGVFVSYKFPILVRGYATYLTSVKEKFSAGDYNTGTATKIGVQYTGFPFIAIGLETDSTSFTNYTNVAGTSSSISSSATATCLTISAPFDF